MDDHELLRRFVRERSQDAFRELVGRHLPMVFATARRIVGDGHLAEEVGQEVFRTLAQKAGTLRPPQVVGGWLYHTARNLALHTVRGEQRRREREQAAVAMQDLEANADEHRIVESLEPALAELEAEERDMLVLRFLEDRSLREVGAEFGISEDAARMRLNRALEQLRAIFSRRGISATSSLLGAALVASTASSAVPVGLSAAVTTAALAGSAATTLTTTHTVVTTMNWINTKTVAATLAAAVIAGTGTYLVREKEARQLRVERQDLSAQLAKLRTENEDVIALAESRQAELDRVQRDTRELLRLRNEVGQLRREAEAEKQRSLAQPPAPIQEPAVRGAPHTPGTYIAKDQLAFVGYATPEAALESTTWAMMTGDYDQATMALGPVMSGNVSADAKAQFEKGFQTMAPLFKGFQILASKTLLDDKVEIKTRTDMDAPPGMEPPPTFYIQPMVKIGNEWKVGGSTREYKPKWDEDGRIQTYAP